MHIALLHNALTLNSMPMPRFINGFVKSITLSRAKLIVIEATAKSARCKITKYKIRSFSHFMLFNRVLRAKSTIDGSPHHSTLIHVGIECMHVDGGCWSTLWQVEQMKATRHLHTYAQLECISNNVCTQSRLIHFKLFFNNFPSISFVQCTHTHTVLATTCHICRISRFTCASRSHNVSVLCERRRERDFFHLFFSFLLSFNQFRSSGHFVRLAHKSNDCWMEKRRIFWNGWWWLLCLDVRCSIRNREGTQHHHLTIHTRTHTHPYYMHTQRSNVIIGIETREMLRLETSG